MSLELILGAILAAIIGGFGLYWKGKSKGVSETKSEVVQHKAEEDKAVAESRIEKVKVASDAKQETSNLPAGVASDRLFDEFSRDR